MRDATEVKPLPVDDIALLRERLGGVSGPIAGALGRVLAYAEAIASVSGPSRKEVEALDRFHTDSDGCMVHDDEGDYLDRVEVLALFPSPSLPVERGEG